MDLSWIWIWLVTNWPGLAVGLALIVGVWWRGITREMIAKMIGDVLALVEAELLQIVQDTPHDLIIKYADRIYEKMDLLAARIPWGLGGLVVNYLHWQIPREKFEQLCLDVWHKYVERQGASRRLITANREPSIVSLK